MEVRDSTNLTQNIKQAIEDVKQTKELIEIAQFAKQTTEFVKDVKDTIGPAVSLAMTASSWMKNADGAMKCLAPDLSAMMSYQFDVTSLCNGLDWARKEFGLPTAGDTNGAIGQARRDLLKGRYSWTSYLSREAKGGNNTSASSDVSPEEIRQLNKDAKKVRAKRQALHHEAAMDGIGLATTMAATGSAGIGEAIDSVAEQAGVVTLQERVGHTNKLLGRILVEMQYQRQIMAKLLMVASSDAIKDEPIIYGLPASTWLKQEEMDK